MKQSFAAIARWARMGVENDPFLALKLYAATAIGAATLFLVAYSDVLSSLGVSGAAATIQWITAALIAGDMFWAGLFAGHSMIMSATFALASYGHRRKRAYLLLSFLHLYISAACLFVAFDGSLAQWLADQLLPSGQHSILEFFFDLP